MSKFTSNLLVVIILILLIIIVAGAGFWYFYSGRIGNRDIYDAVNGQGRQMQEQMDRRSDAIEAKLDRLDAKLSTIHGLSSRTDAQAASIEGKLDKLIKLIEQQQPAKLEPAP